MSSIERVFSPLKVGTLDLRQRIVVPPHGGGNGNIVGTEAEFEQHCALWMAKVHGGMQWVGGGPNFVANPLPLGFEPTGVGAHGPGIFRHPLYRDRIGEMASRVHAAGGYLSVQMVLQGGMPIAPSATFSGYNEHRVPHVMATDEVEWLVREYGESAALAVDSGIDAIEIHANHDDVVQWFLSPLTNLRTDQYGGTPEKRRRFLREIVESIRAHTKRPFTLGLRLCLDEMIEGGYGIETCQDLTAAFSADGTVDYFSFDVGNNWGAPSYIPINWHDDTEWAPLCGQAKQATHLPVVYAGRVTDVAQAEQVLAAGHADLVAMARATMADPGLVNKVRGSDPLPVRPCIGLNECIHRKLVDGLVYACGVNPTFARESTPVPATTSRRPRSLLVVGGGPAGMELASLCAERGHRVSLWDKGDALGGALRIAAMARGNAPYQRWIDYQTQRLDRVGVDVSLSHHATVDDVVAFGADVVAVATGSIPRRPSVAGIDRPHVFLGTEVLMDSSRVIGSNVLVYAEDDGPAPLAIADHVVGLGHRVTLAFPTNGPAPLVGKYSIGAMLARLTTCGVDFVPMARLVGVDDDAVEFSASYGDRRWRVSGFNSVVLACGSVASDSLYHSVRARRESVYLLGDAFAPRRVVFATRQAWELAGVLNE